MALHRRPPALPFILVTLLLDAMGIGIILPVLPDLIIELTGEDLSHAAATGGWLISVYALMQFVAAPIMGNLSDRYGRRPVLLISLVALGIDYIVMGLAPTLIWLFAGRALAGTFGASMSTANAYVADVTTAETRSRAFAYVGAAFSVGFVLGPVVGGLLGELGTRAPFFAAAGLAFANAAYGAFVLPESLGHENRRPFAWGRANMVGALRELSVIPGMMALCVVAFAFQLAHDANPAVWTYYTSLKFGWGPKEIGYSLGFVGLMLAIVHAGLSQWVLPRLGDPRSVALGTAAGIVGFTGFALATTEATLYVFLAIFAMIGFAMAALRGIMSNAVPANAQGALHGALTGIYSITAIIAPLIMTQLFRAFTEGELPVVFPGAPFIAAALAMAIGLAVFGMAVRRMGG